MKIEELLLQDDLLEEGISFFKNSEKLVKLYNAIKQKSASVTDEKDKKTLTELLEKIKNLAIKFQGIEEGYKTSKDKKKVKESYKKLEDDFIDILKLANKEQTKSLLKNIGLYGIMAASLLLPYKIIGILTDKFGVVQSNVTIKELNPFVRLGAFFGSSFLIQGLNPTKLIDKKMNTDVVEKSYNALKEKNI